MTRVVMPLFDFDNESGQEFVFGDGTYSLWRFNAKADIPEENLPEFSNRELAQIKLEDWALVAENANPASYKEDVNRLLLSFKIHTLARLFIKYRFSAEGTLFLIEEKMNYVLPERSSRTVTPAQLNQVNLGFERLREMDLLNSASNRTHNAIYFLYGAYFTARHATYLFVLLFTVLEALFSKETGGSATRTICKRVSSFLRSPLRATYTDIERLYTIRSELVHGRRNASASSDNLADAHELEFVVTECMKKILAERIYLLYRNAAEKEQFFEQLCASQ